MAKRVYPAYLQQWIGRFAICKGSKFYQPSVVYITKVGKYGRLIGFEPNTNTLFEGRPSELIDFTPRLFEKLKWNWLLRERQHNVEFLRKCLRDGRRSDSSC
jgi:hypothetical protein